MCLDVRRIGWNQSFPCLGFKENGKKNNNYLLLYLQIYDLI